MAVITTSLFFHLIECLVVVSALLLSIFFGILFGALILVFPLLLENNRRIGMLGYEEYFFSYYGLGFGKFFLVEYKSLNLKYAKK